MKVIKNDEFNVEIFLNDRVDFNEISIEDYLKNIFYKLNDYYDIKVKGFYDVDVYIDNDYGIVLNVVKDDIDFEPIFNSIDMKIIVNERKFLYKLDGELLFDFGDIYYYNDSYYLDLNRKLSNTEILKLNEYSFLIYKDIDVIKKEERK